MHALAFKLQTTTHKESVESNTKEFYVEIVKKVTPKIVLMSAKSVQAIAKM